MIQKGIIAQVVDKYTYKVRIPKYDKISSATASTKTEDLAESIVCTIPGVDIAYALNDVVLVSFENDELSKPIILGLLYRDYNSTSDISVSNVNSSLSSIKANLDNINSSKLYTHIRYSNDNGITFTSLFDLNYYETTENEEFICRPYYDEENSINGIKINKTARIINWSIIDNNNVDITNTIGIETTIFDSSGNIIRKVSRDEKLYNIVINDNSQISDDLYLDYKIYVSKDYLDTLHVVLNTDKDPLGIYQGKYIGIYTSNNPIASTTPADYSWLSFDSIMSLLRSDFNININEKLLNLQSEIDSKIDNTTTIIYYKEVEWTQSEVDIYCKVGYSGLWSRDLENGYIGEVKAGNLLYITVKNIGYSEEDISDDVYGRLTIRASIDSDETSPVSGTVVSYDVSGEVGIDALVRFKSSLLEEGDETLIYGGHITTGSITARELTAESIYSDDGNSYINLHDGVFSYSSPDPNNNSSISWDGNTLNIIGNINQGSLIGDSQTAHMELSATELGFYDGAQKVAYVNGNQLYINQTVVLQQMNVGKPASDPSGDGKGQWSWKVHNVNGANNLYLKWLG